jgi:hypothetical protein
MTKFLLRLLLLPLAAAHAIIGVFAHDDL